MLSKILFLGTVLIANTGYATQGSGPTFAKAQGSGPSFASAQAPKPIDMVVLLDAATTKDYNMGMSIVENLGFAQTPFITLTVLSTDRNNPLMWRQNVSSNGDFKTNLFRTKPFNKYARRPIQLGKLDTILNGFFSFQNKNHLMTQVAVVLTSDRTIYGDIRLVPQIRKKKFFVVGLGFPKQELSPIWVNIAANKFHIMAIEHQGAIDDFMSEFKILVSKDSQFKCDTDRYKQRGYDHCSDDCISICHSKTLSNYRTCSEECPFFRSINIESLSILNQRTKETSTPKEGFAVWKTVIAILVVVLFAAAAVFFALLYWKVEVFRALVISAKRAICVRFQRNQTQRQSNQDENAPLYNQVDAGTDTPVQVEPELIEENVPVQVEPEPIEENVNVQVKPKPIEENVNVQVEASDELQDSRPEPKPIRRDDSAGNPPNRNLQVVKTNEHEEKKYQSPVDNPAVMDGIVIVLKDQGKVFGDVEMVPIDDRLPRT